MNKKPKNTAVSIITLDEKHTQITDDLTRDELVIIPGLQLEIQELLNKKEELSASQMDDHLDICDKIRACKKKVKQLRNKKKKYLLENSRFIFDYFEQKKNISTIGRKTNSNVLNRFFNIQNEEGINSSIAKKYAQSNNIYQTYWKNVNNEITNIQDFVIPSLTCEHCNKGELIAQEDEGILICNNTTCGIYVPYIIDTSTNKDAPNEVSYTAYIRLNHFKEIISQFQAKETTQIPDQILTDIKNRYKKERIAQTDITYMTTRDILRCLGYNKYFEHIQIINSLLGVTPPIMPEELVETLYILFVEIQQPWAIYCPLSRVNFFNYAYILCQLCVLLGQTHYLPYIKLLKNNDKQREQDQTWKLVCADLDWEYIPSC